MAAALSRGLPVVPRAELLAELMRRAGDRRRRRARQDHHHVDDCGHARCRRPRSHRGHRRPGGAFGSNARLGRGKYFIAEADESDGSFLRLKPRRGGDHEHRSGASRGVRDFDDLQQAFVTVRQQRAGIGRRDPVRRRSAPEGSASVDQAAGGHIRAGPRRGRQRRRTSGWRDSDPCATRERVRDRTASCPCPGRHNVLNALAAVAVGRELGIDWSDIARG